MSRITCALTLALSVSLASCHRPADVEGIPVGTDVQVTRQNGGLVEGTLARRDPDSVTIRTATAPRLIERADIRDVRVVRATDVASVPASAKFREVTVPRGTALDVRLDTAVGSDVNQVNDPVQATLAEPVTIDGREALPAGTRLHGEVSSAQRSGRVEGLAQLSIRFTAASVPGSGDRFPLTAVFAETAEPTKGRDAAKIGAGAAAGAVIGAIAGGGKGAAIGTAAGAGAGTAVVLSTPGREVRLVHGARVSVRLSDAIDVRVPLAQRR